MRVYVNEKKVSFRRRVANIASVVGLGVLIGGMAITLQVRPDNPRYGLWVSVALGALLVGFVAAQIGNYNLRHFARHPRPDEQVDKALKGLDDKYAIYHWLLPADHVLLGPGGLFVIVVRDTKDPVIAHGTKWRQPFKFTRVLGLFGQEGLGDPVGEALDQTERLRRWLQKTDPDFVVDITPLVFFTNAIPLTREQPDVPPVLPKELKKFIRTRAKEARLSEEMYRRLRDLFRTAIQGA